MLFESNLKRRFFMKKITKVFLLVFFLLSFVGYYIFSQNTKGEDVTPTETKSEISQRIVLSNDWIKGLNEVYSLTKNAEIYDELILLKEHGVIGEPKNEGLIPSRQLKDDDFSVITLIASDKQFSPWNEILASPEAASYSGLDKVMVLKNNYSVSLLFKGILLAHETKHRLLDPDSLVLQDAMEYCREEVVVHSFENKLLLQIGGEAYQSLLNQKVDEMNKIASDSSIKARPFSYYADELEKIFGPSLSKEEKMTRVGAFKIGAMFQLVDRYYDGDKKEQKALIMREMYKANGNSLPEGK